MKLFNFLKKKDPRPDKQESTGNILLAMPLFNNGDSYQLNEVINNLTSFWGLSVTDIHGDNQTAVIHVDGERVALANMSVPIPWGDIEGTAQYAYNWQNAAEELKSHTGHAIVSVMSGESSSVDRFRILSKVLCAILSTSNSVGVYKGSQSLLIPKEQYLENINELKENGTPIMLWIYIGLRKSESGNSVYTYGLTLFGKQEIEIINSPLSLSDLFDFAANIAHYIIAGDITLKSGETIGVSAEQKIKIKSSKGVFVDGETFKLEI
jgi:hypothetical protein